MKIKYLEAILAAALLVMAVSGFSYTWTPMGAGSFFGGLYMSANGRILCVCPSTGGQLRISRDRGQTWFIATNAPPGGSVSGNEVALSADGSRIVACLSTNPANQSLVYLSNDVGTNWAKLTLPGISGGSYCVASSGSGSNLLAGAYGGPLYFSTNSGANWSTTSAPHTNWWSLASSASGERAIAAVYGGQIYLSTNFGASWMPTNLPAQNWRSVCISADGQSVGATGTNSYISRNAGAIWITNGISGNSINCSADGTSWVIGGTQLFISSDGGSTWSTNFPATGFFSAMSADGCEIAVKGQTNTVGFLTPSPKLNVQSSSSNLRLSWLLPSTNFVLQQTADLSNPIWTPVSTSPTLNFTSLNQEVTVPANGSNMFYRLSAQ
jgi:hypothetical protein